MRTVQSVSVNLHSHNRLRTLMTADAKQLNTLTCFSRHKILQVSYLNLQQQLCYTRNLYLLRCYRSSQFIYSVKISDDSDFMFVYSEHELYVIIVEYFTGQLTELYESGMFQGESRFLEHHFMLLCQAGYIFCGASSVTAYCILHST